jgi:hypothetical protein
MSTCSGLRVRSHTNGRKGRFAHETDERARQPAAGSTRNRRAEKHGAYVTRLTPAELDEIRMRPPGAQREEPAYTRRKVAA